MTRPQKDEIIFAEELENETIGVGETWKLLVVDDEPEVHEVTTLALKGLQLEKKSLQIISAFSAKEAIEVLTKYDDIAIVMLDVVMENDHAGLDMVKTIRETIGNTLVRIIIRTGQPGVAPERKVIENYDISDYKEKADLSFEKLYTSIYTGLKNYRNMRELVVLSEELRRLNQHLTRENSFLKQEVSNFHSPSSLVGKSSVWRRTIEVIEHIKNSESNVLIYGETGTGKEMIARYIHFSGVLQNKAFITVNCAALTDTLLESELFGHKKGAFTGADYDRKGLFEEADGGTLFLDEVGDMALETQAKILRVIQFGEVKRVGENKSRYVDVRIISATNKDILTLVNEGKFRKDLYYRLAVFHVTVPNLAERMEDVPLLANHFLNKLSGGKKYFEADVIAALSVEEYPGNVRELENKVERMLHLSNQKENIDMSSFRIAKRLEGAYSSCPENTLKLPPVNFSAPFNLKETIHEFEVNILMRAIEMCGGKKNEAARMLGIPERTLFNKLSQ